MKIRETLASKLRSHKDLKLDEDGTGSPLLLSLAATGLLALDSLLNGNSENTTYLIIAIGASFVSFFYATSNSENFETLCYPIVDKMDEDYKF